MATPCTSLGDILRLGEHVKVGFSIVHSQVRQSKELLMDVIIDCGSSLP